MRKRKTSEERRHNRAKNVVSKEKKA